MSYIIDIHAHVDDVSTLTTLLDLLHQRALDEPFIHIATSDPMVDVESTPIPESYFDEVPVNPLAHEFACECCDFETDDPVLMDRHMADVHDNASQVVIDEIARINGKVTTVDVLGVHLDALIKRCDDYEARFRGLLADFNGASNQITKLQEQVRDQNVKYGTLATWAVELSARVSLLEGLVIKDPTL